MPYKNREIGKKYHREYLRKWQQEHPEAVKAIQRKYYFGHREKKLSQTVRANRNRYHRYKTLALEKYGGSPPECKCCKTKIYEFLTIDHINGGGSKHRKSLNNYNGGLYGWLVKTNYKPKQYQVLCMNCNIAKFHYGVCPHKRVGG